MKKLSVLIIDDSETDRYILKRFLLKTDFVSEIIEFNNGKNALEYLAKNELKSPQLVYVDINMPLMGGFEFLENYKHINFDCNNERFFYVISSSSNESDKNKSLSYPFVDEYMVKGNFTAKDLKAKLSKYIDV